MFVSVVVGLLVGCVVTSLSTLFSSLSLNLTQILSATFKSLNLSVQLGGEQTLPSINKQIAYEWGTRLLCGLPAGLSSHKVIEQKRAISEALRSDVDVYWQNGLIIDVYSGAMPKSLSLETAARHDYKVAVGANRRYETKYYDFAGSFPHLLVGGISGGGKSVLLRLILTQLALGPKPDLFLCDLKGGVELNLFKDLAITKGFATALDEVVSIANMVESEMNRRYAIMEQNGSQEWDGKRIVFVMDELADLKSRPKDPDVNIKSAIKTRLTTISAKGRAAGVILVLCTQRPSADIVDGLIKTNIATSICFRTRDTTQSRIILDNNDAADLPDVPGRCIYQQAKDETLQTYYLSYEDAKKLLEASERKPMSIHPELNSDTYHNTPSKSLTSQSFKPQEKAVEVYEPFPNKGYAVDSNIDDLG